MSAAKQRDIRSAHKLLLLHSTSFASPKYGQEYIRGGRESILLYIAVCKHPLPSTEVNVVSTVQTPFAKYRGQVTQSYTQAYHKRLA